MPIDNRIQGGAFPDSHDAFDSSIKISPLNDSFSKRDIPESNLSTTQSFPTALNTEPTLTDFTAQSAPASSTYFNNSGLEQSTLQDSWNATGNYNGLSRGIMQDEPLISSTSAPLNSQPDTWSTQENYSRPASDVSSLRSDIPITDSISTTAPSMEVLRPQYEAGTLEPVEQELDGTSTTAGGVVQRLQEMLISAKDTIAQSMEGAKESISHAVDAAKESIANVEARSNETQFEGQQDQSFLNRIEQKLEQGAQISMAAVGAVVNSFRKPEETSDLQMLPVSSTMLDDSTVLASTLPIDNSGDIRAVILTDVPVVVTTVEETPVIVESQEPGFISRNVDVAKEKAAVAYDGARQVIVEQSHILADKAAVAYDGARQVIVEQSHILADKAAVAYEGAKQVISEQGQIFAEKAAVVFEGAKQSAVENAQILKEKAAVAYEGAKQSATENAQILSDKAAVAYEGAKQSAAENAQILKEKAAIAYEGAKQSATENAQILSDKAAVAYEGVKQSATENAQILSDKAAVAYEGAKQSAAENAQILKEKAAVAYEGAKQSATENAQILSDKAAVAYEGAKQSATENAQILSDKAAVAYEGVKQSATENAQILSDKAAVAYEGAKQSAVDNAQVLKEKAAVAYETTKDTVSQKVDESKVVIADKSQGFQEDMRVKNDQFQQMLVDTKENLSHVIPSSADSNFDKAKDALESKFLAGEARNNYLEEKLYESPEDSFSTTVGHKVEQVKQLGVEAGYNAKAEIRKKQLESSFTKESDL